MFLADCAARVRCAREGGTAFGLSCVLVLAACATAGTSAGEGAAPATQPAPPTKPLAEVPFTNVDDVAAVSVAVGGHLARLGLDLGGDHDDVVAVTDTFAAKAGLSSGPQHVILGGEDLGKRRITVFSGSAWSPPASAPSAGSTPAPGAAPIKAFTELDGKINLDALAPDLVELDYQTRHLRLYDADTRISAVTGAGATALPLTPLTPQVRGDLYVDATGWLVNVRLFADSPAVPAFLIVGYSSPALVIVGSQAGQQLVAHSQTLDVTSLDLHLGNLTFAKVPVAAPLFTQGFVHWSRAHGSASASASSGPSTQPAASGWASYPPVGAQAPQILPFDAVLALGTLLDGHRRALVDFDHHTLYLYEDVDHDPTPVDTTP
jgi:hypothetical protein